MSELRAEKLAAARKKLREFQQKTKHSKNQNGIDGSRMILQHHNKDENNDDMTLSTHSSLNGLTANEEEHHCYQETEGVLEINSESTNNASMTKAEGDRPGTPAVINQFPSADDELVRTSNSTGQKSVESTTSELPIYSYFSSGGFDSAYNLRSNFFDTVPHNEMQGKESEKSTDSGDLFNTAVYLDNKFYSNLPLFKHCENESADENPTNKLDDMYENVHKSTVTTNDAREISEYLEKRDSCTSNVPQQLEDLNSTKERNEYFEKKDEKEDNDMLDEISSLKISDISKTDDIQGVQQSNVESLLQLSSQMSHLIDSSTAFDTNQSVNELEQRNRKLATLLDEEQVRSRQLSAQLVISGERISDLERTVEKMRLESETKIKCELAPIQEQLQNHVQTIGVLVAEKTELSAMINQAQASCKQKVSELEEAQARLRTSRSRVSALESELNALKADKMRQNQIESEHREAFNKLKSEYEEMRRARDEISQDVSELREKYSTCSAENIKLQEQLREVNSQLSLANIKIQQLTVGETAQNNVQVELLVQQNLALEKQVSEMNEAMAKMASERDQASSQYQQYVVQLNGQLSNLSTKLESAIKENESLVTREQNLIRHIGELERHLQTERANILGANINEHTERDLREALNKIELFDVEKQQMEENFTRVSNERDMLLKDLESKRESIAELESLVERLQVFRPDTSKLLATMESDKVAAAMAASQNAELKKQLQVIQDDFIKMCNDKLELTEHLTKEQNANKDLTEKLYHSEIQLQTLVDAIGIKDNELIELRENCSKLNKEVLQLNQLADRLRHYEAHDNSSQALLAELQEAKQKIALLTNENSSLKETLNKKNSSAKGTDEEEDGEKTNRETTLIESGRNCGHTVHDLDKESATKHLEQKFLRTMQEIANLTEEKQRLEHLVLQLQSETETIGEYIALYQHQRGILKQRAVEKDEQLKQLAHDREQMKNKLDQLNALVKKLVLEKGALTPEILEHQESMNQHSHHLCEEHAKIHEEIGKITKEGVVLGMNGINSHEATEGKDTAEKIIALLSDIKTSSLVQPSDNFHPCPWCSGKLITV